MRSEFGQSAQSLQPSNYSTLPTHMIPYFSRLKASIKTFFFTGGAGGKTYIAHFMRESVKKE